MLHDVPFLYQVPWIKLATSFFVLTPSDHPYSRVTKDPSQYWNGGTATSNCSATIEPFGCPWRDSNQLSSFGKIRLWITPTQHMQFSHHHHHHGNKFVSRFQTRRIAELDQRFVSSTNQHRTGAPISTSLTFIGTHGRDGRSRRFQNAISFCYLSPVH